MIVFIQGGGWGPSQGLVVSRICRAYVVERFSREGRGNDEPIRAAIHSWSFTQNVMRNAYDEIPALFSEILIRASHVKRSKSLPALKPFSAKNGKNPWNNFERFRVISRMRISKNREGSKGRIK